VVQRIRIRYAKRGRLRFTSHRDFARAFERALRRAAVPMAYSAGFTPHPKISYVGASPTGAASEAEYLEIGLAQVVDVAELRATLDAALPDGLDIVEAVVAGPGSLADRMEASAWRIELPGVAEAAANEAVERFLASDEVLVERMMKSGRRAVDVRAGVLRAAVSGAVSDGSGAPHAIIEVVVRQVTPAVRPDDFVAALRDVAGLALDAPPLAVRQAQGPLGAQDAIGDPLDPDRAASAPAS
jgi:radical SAM-linked protein